MCPILVFRGRQFIPPLDDEDAGVADVSPPLVLNLETAGETRGVPVTCCKAGAENWKKSEKNQKYLISTDLLDFALHMQQPFWDLNIFGLKVVILTHSNGISEKNRISNTFFLGQK